MTLLVLIAAASTLNANPLERLYHFWQADTFKASFTQRVYDEKNSLIENSTGTTVIKRPGRFRWEYLTPSRQLLLADGFNFIIYDPELEQAIIQPLPSALGHAPIMLLLRKHPSFEDFDVRASTGNDDLDWIILTPKVQDMEFTRIELGLKQQNIVRIKMRDHFNQLTVIDFIRTDLNAEVAPEEFRLHLPEKTDIINKYPDLDFESGANHE